MIQADKRSVRGARSWWRASEFWPCAPTNRNLGRSLRASVGGHNVYCALLPSKTKCYVASLHNVSSSLSHVQAVDGLSQSSHPLGINQRVEAVLLIRLNARYPSLWSTLPSSLSKICKRYHQAPEVCF